VVDALQRGVNFDFLSIAEEFGAAVSFANRASPQPYEANKSIIMLKAAMGKGPV
jgi:hypothetical protein